MLLLLVIQVRVLTFCNLDCELKLLSHGISGTLRRSQLPPAGDLPTQGSVPHLRGSVAEDSLPLSLVLERYFITPFYMSKLRPESLSNLPKVTEL